MMQTPTTSRDSGFTLVELMVTVVIATILVSIAIPTYTSQIRKSKRTDAKTALLDLAGREERYMATNSAYTSDASLLGYGTGATFPVTLPNNDYTINVTTLINANNGATPPTPASYILTATTTGTQNSDTQCHTFTLDNKGVQSATSTTCW
jgi:type IV pilus assembly protein PilE